MSIYFPLVSKRSCVSECLKRTMLYSLNSGDEDEDENQEEEKVKDTGNVSPAIYGSRAMTYGGGNDLIADQFYLYTVQQKHNQIVLIQVFIDIIASFLLLALPN